MAKTRPNVWAVFSGSFLLLVLWHGLSNPQDSLPCILHFQGWTSIFSEYRWSFNSCLAWFSSSSIHYCMLNTNPQDSRDLSECPREGSQFLLVSEWKIYTFNRELLKFTFYFRCLPNFADFQSYSGGINCGNNRKLSTESIKIKAEPEFFHSLSLSIWLSKYSFSGRIKHICYFNTHFRFIVA